jgi:CheY-like chemotaxis protein
MTAATANQRAGLNSTDILLVDDNVAYRRALRRVVEAAGSMVIGEAGTGEDAVAMVSTLRPELVLMDVRLPGIGGIEAASRIAALQLGVRVVLMTASLSTAETDIARSGLECLLKETIRPNTLSAVIVAARASGYNGVSAT